jgi:hypothetical protein
MIALFNSTTRATEYWGPEELARHARTGASGNLQGVHLPPPNTGRRGSIDYGQRFAMVAEFLTTLQVSDTSSASYGGIEEGEAQWLTIQTDNTQEAIWIWSRYTELTGDDIYVPNIAAAWSYVMNHPAYNEEGGGGELGYYRIYNCAWAMAAEAEYRQVFGDSTFLWYSDSAAGYVTNNPLNLYGPPPYDILNGMVTGWAAGNLYGHGESVGDTTVEYEAASIGSLVKEWAEGDPSARLGGWNWAMSGGAAFWGIVNSYFKRYPEGLRSWSEIYDDYLQTYVNDTGWQNAWNLWFALGHYTAWDTQGDFQRKQNHKAIIDFLVGLDGDGDGGIGVSETAGNLNDQSWVTSYLGFMGLNKLLAPADMVIVPDTVVVSPGDTLLFTGYVASNQDADLTLEGWADIYLPDGTPLPSNPVLGPMTFLLPGGGSTSLTFSQSVPSGAPAGTYDYRGTIGLWPSHVIDMDDAWIEVVP